MRPIFWLLLSVALAVGCDDEQDVDAGTSPGGNGGQASAGAGGSGAGGGGTTAGTDAGGTAGAAGASGGAAGSGGEGGASGGAAGTTASGSVVLVEYAGLSKPVDLGTVPTTEYKGLTLARMSDVWAAAGPLTDLSKVQFDFEGSDGFRPSSKPNCKVRITGPQLSQGYLEPTLRNLFWDDSLGLSGCYSVKDLARIIATDIP